MARNVLVSDIISRARIHCDQRDRNYITDDEALSLFNEITADLYDEMIAIDDNYFSNSYTFSISSDSQDYAVPDDFYKIIGVDFNSSPGNEKITLYPFNEAERNISFTQATSIPSGTIYLTYVPACPVYALTDNFDGISGWDRLLSLRLAIDMADSEESNSDRLQRKYDATLQRIRETLERDIGMPATVSDVTRPSVQYLYSTLKYRLYGNNLRFVSTEFLGAAAFAGPFI